MLLQVRDLGIAYGKGDPVVRHVSFDLDAGQVLAIVGESGSGKTTVIRAIQHVLPGGGHIAEGQVILNGEDTQKQTAEMHRSLCGTDVSMIFQDSGAMMNPIHTIGRQYRDFLAVHGLTDEKEAHDRMISMLEMVRLPDPEQVLKSYTYELSGGMRQRVMIAMALSSQPDILIADEPTTALDVTIQAQILNLIKKLNRQFGMTTMLITHDLGVVATVCDKVAVMYGGLIMEYGTADEIFYHPRHPYTMGLLGSIPHVDGGEKRRLIPIDGTPPDLINPPKGCPFSTRCKYCMNVCTQEQPPYFAEDKHRTMCWMLDADAPKDSDYEMRKAGVNFGR